MNLRQLVLGLAFVASGSLVASAHAGGVPDFLKIVDTGFSEFDGVFGRARDLQGTVKGEYDTIVGARSNVNTALGMTPEKTLREALEDLKAKAEGKIQLVMDGRIPRLQAKEAMPENIQKGIDAVNGLADQSAKSQEAADKLQPQTEALVEESKGFPAKVPGLVKNPFEVGKKAKIVNNDCKAVAQLPERVNGLRSEAQGTATDIATVFAEAK